DATVKIGAGQRGIGKTTLKTVEFRAHRAGRVHPHLITRRAYWLYLCRYFRLLLELVQRQTAARHRDRRIWRASRIGEHTRRRAAHRTAPPIGNAGIGWVRTAHLP